MQQFFASNYTYVGWHNSAGHCFLQLYGDAGCRVVAVVTEMPDNAGTSVTNLAEHLAAQIWVATGRPATFVWVEHYPAPADRDGGDEDWSWITFAGQTGDHFSGPVWQPLTAAAVAAVLEGQRPLPREWSALPEPALSPRTVITLLHRCQPLAMKLGTVGYRIALTPAEQALLAEPRRARDAGWFEAEAQTQELRQAAELRPSDLSMLLGRLHADAVSADPRLAILETIAALRGTKNNPQTS